jgi:phosphonate transport system ATP-binding protein
MAASVLIRRFSKSFVPGKPVLDEITLDIRAGEMVALLGASGSGKSTLLRQIAGLQRGDSTAASAIVVGTQSIQHSGRLARNVRDLRSGIGVVFQQFNLVERLPVLTNVLVGMLHRVPVWRSLFKWFTRDEIAEALRALTLVGIRDQAYKRAAQLSGGQQQRAAIARAVVQRAKVILADEPIASLDPESSRRVMELLAKINSEQGTTIIVSLHQVDYALRYCPRTVALRHGKVVFDGLSRDLTPTRLRELYGADDDLALDYPAPSVASHAKPVPHSPPPELALAQV